MSSRPASAGARCPRRGGVIMEVVVAMVIFVAAAGFTLRASSDVLTAIDRSARRQLATDLARSKLAELEMGLVSIEELRDAEITSVGSIESFGDALDDPQPGQRVWMIDVDTQPSEIPGLTVVEITVREEPFAAALPGDDEAAGIVRFTLRQLVRLREARVEEYEDDDLLRGLPEVRQ